MAVTSDILDAFCGHVAIVAAGLGLPVGYPGVRFTPPTAGGWIEVDAHWNGNTPYALAADGPSVELGFFRVLVNWRTGAGPMPAQDAAEAIAAAIPKGSTFATAMTERQPSITGLLVDPDRLVIPVTVRWRATR